MRKKFRTRALSVLLSATMVFSSMPMAYAAPLGEEADTVSEHEHSEECYSSELICGYDTETEEATDSNSAHVHTQECYALECEGESNGEIADDAVIEDDAAKDSEIAEEDYIIIATDSVAISTDASYLIINDRFGNADVDGGDGCEYKEIGPQQAQLWDASGVSGNFVVPETVTSDVTGEVYEVVSISSDVFAGNKKLTGITLDKRFDEIEGALFEGCTKLKTVTFEDGFTTIGEELFKDSGVTTVVVEGDTLTTIGASAFENCDKLKEITIPDSVVQIDERAFADCDKLAEVNLGDSVLTIGTQAFASCPVLQEIEIPATVTTVGQEAFLDCTNLLSVVIGDSNVLSLDANMVIVAEAFVGCESLETVDIQSSVIKISEKAFYHCDELSSVSLPDSLEIIEDSAFEYCDSLVDVQFGTSPDTAALKSIGDCAFRGIGRSDIWGYSLTDGSAEDATDENGQDYMKIVLPNKLESIGDSAFENSGIKEVQFGSDPSAAALTSIGEYAFARSDIGSVYNYDNGEFAIIPLQLPNKLEVIESGAFSECYSLCQVIFGSSQEDSRLETIELGAFYNSSLGEVETYNSETGAWEYIDCPLLLPNSLVTIEDYAFYRCSYLKTIVFGTSQTAAKLESIGVGAFSTYSGGQYSIRQTEQTDEDSSDVMRIVLPDTLKNIGAEAFYCSPVQDVQFGSGLESIGDSAFAWSSIGAYYDENLGEMKTITIEFPNNLKTIGNSAFAGCDDLGDVRFGTTKGDAELVSIGTNAFYHSGIYGRTEVDDYDEEFTILELPNSLKTIGDNAFLYCDNLNRVEFGTSLKVIGENAFYGCRSLYDVNFDDSEVSNYK